MTRFWQYKVYADIRGGSHSQDLCNLCKLSLDFMPYVCILILRTRTVPHAFSLSSLTVLFIIIIDQYGCGGL